MLSAPLTTSADDVVIRNASDIVTVTVIAHRLASALAGMQRFTGAVRTCSLSLHATWLSSNAVTDDCR